MDDNGLWAFLFGMGAVVLFVLEALIPSGGILGGLSALSAIGMIWCLFTIDTGYGVAGIMAVLILAPIATVIAIHVFPHTPFGRRMILNDRQRVETDAHGDDTPDPEDQYLGKRGRTLGRLNPGGVVLLEGQRVHCVADRGLLEPGTDVEVIAVNGMEIRVRAI